LCDSLSTQYNVSMRLGAFNLIEPVPELNEPHAFTVVRPWIDAGSSGSLTLSCLGNILSNTELGRLRRPGNFFDLTRYRPTVQRDEDHVDIDIPNAVISYAKQERGHDFLFLRLPEPHMLAEIYVDSVVELLNVFSAKRYCLIGSMYDMVPYTRPLLVTGAASNQALQNELDLARVVSSSYQGPTTILSLLGQKTLQLGMETFSLVVHIPNYLSFEEDYRGVIRLMEILQSLYGFTTPEAYANKAKEQEQHVSQLAEQVMQQEPRYRIVLNQLEANYDARVGKQEETRLSPEVERFLQDIESRFGQGQ
jgi:predicted ATP-grasp superfamily ATP-dependent carboligase